MEKMNKVKLSTTFRKMAADLYTPVGIYLRLRDKFRDTILLESTDHHTSENSFSFIAINAIGKSFTQESAQRNLFYYTIASPEAIIFSKITYNTLVMTGISLIGIVFYSWVMGNPVGNFPLYLLSLVLGAIGFSATLSMVAGIAAQGENTATLMAVLSFPIILPLLLMLLKVSKSAMDGLSIQENWDEIAILTSIDVIVIVLSGILFPYIWRH